MLLVVIARVEFFRVSGRVGFDFSGFGSGRVFILRVRVGSGFYPKSKIRSGRVGYPVVLPGFG